MLQGPRRILVIVVSLIAIPIATPIATSAASSAAAVAYPAYAGGRTPADQPPLAKRGDRSPTVRKMQQLLVKAGIAVKGGVDGIFGPGTEAAVRDYQTRRGLTSNGVLDVPTAIVLGMVQATPILSRGARGDDVRVVQQQLVTLGLSLFGGVDGVYGSATVATLKVFQRSKGLVATGAVDAATAEILANAAAALIPTTTTPTTAASPTTTPDTTPTTIPATAVPPTTAPPTIPPPTAPPTTVPPTATPPNVVLLSLGSHGEDVKTMQRLLIAVGITVFGGADGVFGPATQASLKQFQTRVGLPANGVYDTATQAALTAAAPAPTPPPATPPGAVVLTVFPVPATCSFTDTFGAPRSGGRKHQGVDIIVAAGTPIYAVMNGTITKKQLDFVGSLGGNSLWLSAADGTYFYYAHLSAFAPGIEVGSVLTAGTVIGYVGKSGNAGVPHLHFEVHPLGGPAVNPTPIVKAATSCT